MTDRTRFDALGEKGFARAKEALGNHVIERSPLPPAPDSQTEEGHRRLQLSGGRDNLARRMELLEIAGDLGWPRITYRTRKAQVAFEPPRILRGGEASWEHFAKNAHFVVLAPVLRKVRAMREYKRQCEEVEREADSRVPLLAPDEEFLKEPDPYPNLTKARTARKEKRDARLRVPAPDPA